MASHLLLSTSLYTLPKFQNAMFVSKRASSNEASPFKPLRLVITMKNLEEKITTRSLEEEIPTRSLEEEIPTRSLEEKITTRRSGNYPLSIWGDDYIQSLNSVYTENSYTKRVEKLKKDVRLMLDKVMEPLDQLMLIDDLQRLGVSYHFEDVIKKILNNIYITHSDGKETSLFFAALEFRLLRQHGFHVAQETFSKFKDEMGNFKQCLGSDTEGILSLYEASYHSLQDESILDDARDFTTKHLVSSLNGQDMDQLLAMQISHALELPQHWMVKRQETRWFVEIYARRSNSNPILLELAKLDFNIVQAVHLQELKITSRWWRNTGLAEKLSFGRDRLVESFLWAMGVTFEPQYGYCRKMITKVIALINIIDDIYDVYGTLDELVLFTDAVERWDINSTKQLPDYMKICFLSLFNTVNEIAYDVLKEQGCDITPYLKKEWADVCNSYLMEAKWYHNEYIPTVDEYLKNASTSITVPLILVHIYFSLKETPKNDGSKCLKSYSSVIHWSSLICRLIDDLGTSSDELKRGDVPKAIQCYMHETGTSEKEAREYIQNLIEKTWKKMNEDRLRDSQLSNTFIDTAINFVRIGKFMYQRGDEHGVSSHKNKDRVLPLLIEPFHL